MIRRYLWSSHKNVYGGMGKRKWEQHRTRALEWLTAALELLPTTPVVERESVLSFTPSDSTNESLPENVSMDLSGPVVDEGDSARIRCQQHLCLQDICKRLLGNTRMWGRDAMFTSASKQRDFQTLRKVLKAVSPI